MSEQNKPIVVPWDFSELATFALEHAVNLAKSIESDIILAHIVKRKSDIEVAIKKLETTTNEHEAKYGIKPLVDVREGSIFSVISDIIEEVDASFAVMGTHGIKGMQKFTGSWALKVIAGSKAPFIVVQAPPPATSKGFENIVFPVDFKFSAKEKLVWASFMSKFYKSKFFLCYLDVSDIAFKKKIYSNMIVAKKYLTEKRVDFEIVQLEGRNISDEAVAYAKETNADMIMIATTKNISFQDYVLGASEQKIIANREKIPVMCVNPREGLTKYSGLT